MNIFQFSEVEILLFILMLLRIASFWFTWPLFSGDTAPNFVKISIVLVMTMGLFPLVAHQKAGLSLDSNWLMLYAARETLVGISMGFICRLFFFILSAAGEMISSSVGFSQGSLYNPLLGTQVSSLEQFYVILGTLFFISIRGHHALLSGLAQSFEMVPFGSQIFKVQATQGLVQILIHVVEMALKIAAPVVATLFVLNFGLGVLGRAVPQLNILVTSFPLNVLVGLFIILVGLPLLFTQMDVLTETTALNLFKFLRGF